MGSESSSPTRTQRARRDDIVAAAISVIDSDGFAAASVDRIASEAGTIKGTALYHFKTKDAICEAVIAALYEQGGSFMTSRLQDTESVGTRLATDLRSNLEFICAHAAHVRAVQRIIENSPQHRDHVPDSITPLSELLTAGQRSGEFTLFDPLIVAGAIRALIDASAYHLANSNDVDVDHFVSEIMQFVERATTSAHNRRKSGQ
ncbi:TetR/AcrR family transcriptional regulator [Nocardia sp. CDC160]|uniref:TetR/AcrR family transcriptional regulator n=1 Tax=Nocardia sp. CDC160 TaxID=3112166 RepID=UPI002DB8B0B8|nr:TetR/AcrR family transcriptional regulator [Nocardia sp. CDC160]MEC3919235.1 TetR/AcrR family transcriptional regulator [Nocardia sp. CDC160]